MRHTLSVLVENKFGVLARVSNLFARRGFNIHSLDVCVTDRQDRSRMTIVVDLPDRPLEQVTRQLDKLINVLEVRVLSLEQSVDRELMLITFPQDAKERAQIMQFIELFKAKVLDLSEEDVLIEVTGSQAKIQALEDLVRPFRIIEIVKTNRISIGKASGSATQRELQTID